MMFRKGVFGGGKGTALPDLSEGGWLRAMSVRVWLLAGVSVLLLAVACGDSSIGGGRQDAASGSGDAGSATGDAAVDAGGGQDAVAGQDAGCTPAFTECGEMCGPVYEPCSDLSFSCGGCSDGTICNLLTHRCEEPKITCEELGAECGTPRNSCGKFTICGDCPDNEQCNPMTFTCEPCAELTCADMGLECGSAWLGCGPKTNTVDCGDPCGTGSICNLRLNICEPQCDPPTTAEAIAAACEARSAECGTITDGCGGELDCGTCADGQLCGIRGVANRCSPAPAPIECVAMGAECGEISGVCGEHLDCGSCPEGEVCRDNHTCGPPCEPKTCDSPEYAGKCGQQLDDGCGLKINCGCEPGTQVCSVSDIGALGICLYNCREYTTRQVGESCSDGPTAAFPVGDGTNLTCACDAGDGKTNVKCEGWNDTTAGTCQCVARTCSSDTGTFDCRLDGQSDGCGGTLSCKCTTGTCQSDGNCCKKKTCSTDYPNQCGTALSDGCGGTINCSCGTDKTCSTSVAGTPGVCYSSCGVYTDSKPGDACSTQPDSRFPKGDGTNLTCDCLSTDPDFKNNQCASPTGGLCVCEPRDCYVSGNFDCRLGGQTDYCGGTLQCPCPPGQRCMSDGSCCTIAQCSDPAYAGHCGTGFSDGCGATFSCPCPEGYVCDTTQSGVLGSCVKTCALITDGLPGSPCSTTPTFDRGDGVLLTCPCVSTAVYRQNECINGTCECIARTCSSETGTFDCRLDRKLDYCGGLLRCKCPTGDVCMATDGSCCTPKTCSSPEYAGKCGRALDNGCGGTIDCSCGDSTQTCSTTTAGAVGSCLNTCATFTTRDVGQPCSTTNDTRFPRGDGSYLICNCDSSGGYDNILCSAPTGGSCQCTKDTCTAGSCTPTATSDGCGGVLSCSCSSTDYKCMPDGGCCLLPTCPATAIPTDGTCVFSNCGQTVTCTCADPYDSCGGGGVPGVCGCTKRTSCVNPETGLYEVNPPDGCGGIVPGCTG